MLEHYRLASTNISSTYKKAEPVVVLPNEYLETLFNKKINKLVEGYHDISSWINDGNAFDQKFIEICQK